MRGSAAAYRLYDIGYAIDLDRVSRMLGDATRGRSRPARSEAQTFQIHNPPLFASLGQRTIVVGDQPRQARLSAQLFDFGVCSLRLTVEAPDAASWEAYTRFGSAVDKSADVAATFDTELAALLDRIRAAVERPLVAPVTEDYIVFRVDTLESDDGHAAPTDDQLVALLVGETRPLAASARQDLLANRFSFYADDLAILTWDNALVVEPRAADEDVEFVLEFANAQLLELRVYDAELDAELPALYGRIAARRQRWRPITRTIRPLLAELQTRVTEITEVVERVDNAFKVTDDVYLARVYGAALELFRERAWRRGIDRKLQIFRDTYTMLNAEAQVVRAELLEIIVVLLIAAELIQGFVR